MSCDAAGLALRPGLWQVSLVRQIVDGHDVSAQLTESVAKEDIALARLSPQERARVVASHRHPAVNPGGNASFRICITPLMASRDLPVIDPNDRCRPQRLGRHGHRISFRIDCTVEGTRLQGQGDAYSMGGVVHSANHLRTRNPDGSTHTMQNDTQMRYLGAQCDHSAAH